ncbi:MAG: outer membrane lipoprotein-sorting protein, partial [Fidelibacterota bacterium]
MSRIFALLALLTLSLAAQQPTVKEIIDGMTALMNQEYSKATMTQTIQTSSGKTRTLEFEMFSADTGSSVLIKYIKPTSVRGQAFLMLNDANDIWTYFPRTRRVRK